MLLDVEDFVLFLFKGEMREGEMRGVDRAFHRLHPVAVLPFLGDVAVRGRHQRHFQRGQFRHLLRRAHIGPDHVAPFAHRIGFDADQVLGVEIGIGGRHVDAAAVGVELPAVIDAADAAFLVAAEPEIGAAMRAILVDDADHAARVAEGEQFLAHHDDLLRRAVGFRQFRRQQHRHPEPAQQFAHSRSRAALGQEFVVFCAEHGCPPEFVLLFAKLGAGQARRQRRFGRADGIGERGRPLRTQIIRDLAAHRARVLPGNALPSASEGAGKTGCALHPRSRAQNSNKKRTRAYRFSGSSPAFPAQWF